MTTHSPTAAPIASEARRAIRSEAIKLRSLRSQVWLLIVATAFVLLLGPIQSLGQVVTDSPLGSGDLTGSAMSLALTGATTASLILGVLGVLVVAGEYANRSIRTTFTLVPHRPVVVLAKAVSFAQSAVLPLSLGVVGAVTVSLTLLHRVDPAVVDDLDVVVRISAVMVWYLIGWSIFGMAAGWLTRSKIGGAALLISVMYFAPPLLGLVPGEAGEALVAAMPSTAGAAMLSTSDAGAPLSPAVALLVWTAYVLVLPALAAVLVRTRDA